MVLTFSQAFRSAFAAALLLVATRDANAGMHEHQEILRRGFLPIEMISLNNIEARVIKNEDMAAAVSGLCKKIDENFRTYRLHANPCGKVKWQARLKTGSNQPLIYAEFGQGTQVTLVLGGVHPDEITPVPLTFRFAEYMQAHPELYTGNDLKIVVAPLVNPEGFLRSKPTRTNAAGIDPNRNFFTHDWYALAKTKWVREAKRNPRIFPGNFPNSEIETLFQISLIEMFGPAKILSLHAPLTFLDYDGPGDRKLSMTPIEQRAKQLVHEIALQARDYRVVDYSFYPGSLGNYAGNERSIPTVTVELNTTDPAQADKLWKQFLPGMLEAIRYRVDHDRTVQTDSTFFQPYDKIISQLHM